MSIAFTDRAREVIARADEAARRLNPDARVRLAEVKGALFSLLSEGPEEGDQAVEVGDATVFVAAGIAGTIDAGEHDRLVLR